MTKSIKTMMYQIKYMVLFGLLSTLCSTLEGAQAHNSSEELKANKTSHQQAHANKAQKTAARGVNHVGAQYQSQAKSMSAPPPAHQANSSPVIYPNRQPPLGQCLHNPHQPVSAGGQISITNNTPQISSLAPPATTLLPYPNHLAFTPLYIPYLPLYNLNSRPLCDYIPNYAQYGKIHIINTQNNCINVQTVHMPLYTPQYSPNVPQTNNTPDQPSFQPYAPGVYRPKNPYHAWSCSSIQACQALSTVIACLEYWRMCTDTGCVKSIFQYLYKGNSYMHIVDAYHHLLAVHLSGKNSQGAYRYIHREVKKALHCNFATCNSYARNQRVRGQEEKTAYQDYDKGYIFLRDLLDTIHGYLVHGYDSGHRYVSHDRQKRLKSALDDDQKYQEDNDRDIDGCLFDHEVKALQAWQVRIKSLQPRQARGDRFQLKKPPTDQKISLARLKAKFGDDPTFQQWMQYLLASEYDTDCLLAQIEDNDSSIMYHCFALEEKAKGIFFNKIKAYIKQHQDGIKNHHQLTNQYGFGVKLYYWPYFKQSTKKNIWHHPGTPYKDLYVPPAYLSFKSEMLAKGISITQWDQKMYESGTMLDRSSTLRKIRACGHRPSLCRKYKIKESSSMSVYHMLSVLFYTNFTKLSTAFQATFSYLSATERVQDIIVRNARWHFLSKYLREVVEIFGENVGLDDQYNSVDKGSFYHGAPYIPFSECKAYFYTPLSTSRQLSVATLFADRAGLLLELKSCPRSGEKLLKFFNVGLMSCFAAEEENLFIGGQYPLQIASLRLLQKPTMHTAPLMHTLKVVNKMTHGDKLIDGQVLPADIALFKKLLSHAPSLPPYVAQLWHGFTHRPRTKIKFNMKMMYTYYSLFIPLFFSSDPKKKHLLRFDQISNIFPNTHEIICAATDIIFLNAQNQGYSGSIVNANFILGLKDCIRNMARNKSQKIKKITIRTSQSIIKDSCNLYIKQFGALGWYIGKGRNAIEVTRQPYDDCIAKILLMIRTTYPVHETTSLDLIMFKQLISKAKQVPACMQQKWNEFAHNQQTIRINIKTIHKYYPFFVPELLCPARQCKNLLLFDKLRRIFPNVKEIICTSTDNINGGAKAKDYSAAIINKGFILGLIAMLRKMTKQTQLKKIRITTSQYKIRNGCKLYASLFGDLGWHITKGAHTIVVAKHLYDDFEHEFIGKISSMLEGVVPQYEVTSWDITLLHKLTARAKDIPSDIQQAWDQFSGAQQSIVMSIKCMHKCYKALYPLLVSKSTPNLLRFDKIIQIFPNATEVISAKTDYIVNDKGWIEGFSPLMVGSDFISGLHVALASHRWGKLKKIIIKSWAHEIKVDCKAYATQFGMLGWEIHKENRKNNREINGRIVLTRAFFKNK